MRIEQLKTVPDRTGRYRVLFSDGSTFRLYRQTIEDHSLYSGKELSDAEYTALMQSAEKMSARMRAVRITAAASISEKALLSRLVQKGESPDASHEAVQWMKEMTLVDDAKTARQIVESCVSKGFGLARAKQALYEKRIPREYWDQALADYPDQSDCIRRFLRVKCGDLNDPRSVKKCVDALLRRGHSYGSIRAAIKQLGSDMMEDEY